MVLSPQSRDNPAGLSFGVDPENSAHVLTEVIGPGSLD
jgi:hypothetical protein